MLLLAGTSHLTFAREEFAAQVPPWVPVDTDTVVVGSGLVELALGGALVALPKQRVAVGWVVAAFFVAIFPGNISQLVTRTDAFGLDSDRARAIRLVFQPLLVSGRSGRRAPGRPGGRAGSAAADRPRRSARRRSAARGTCR